RAPPGAGARRPASRTYASDVADPRRRTGSTRPALARLPVGALVLDDDGAVVDANERAAALLGADLDALVGTPLTDHVHADHRDRLAPLATGRPKTDEPVVVR